MALRRRERVPEEDAQRAKCSAKSTLWRANLALSVLALAMFFALSMLSSCVSTAAKNLDFRQWKKGAIVIEKKLPKRLLLCGRVESRHRNRNHGVASKLGFILCSVKFKKCLVDRGLV